MRNIEQWLEEYNESHQHRTNKILHWVCVPLIVLSLFGLLWTVPLPVEIEILPFQLNWAIILLTLALIYYSILSIPLAIGMLLVVSTMLYMLHSLAQLQVPLWLLSVIVFVLAWIGQFIGHQIEGKRPSFFKDVQFLLIGPLWLLSFIYHKLDIRY
jgi:uncharacterized membrane protein YGL010W